MKMWCPLAMLRLPGCEWRQWRSESGVPEGDGCVEEARLLVGVKAAREVARKMREEGLHLQHGEAVANAHALAHAEGQVRAGTRHLSQ